MTLLSTITSLGWFASTTLALRIVDNLTFEKCSVGVQNSCSTPDLKSVSRYKFTVYKRDIFRGLIGYTNNFHFFFFLYIYLFRSALQAVAVVLQSWMATT